MSRISGKLDKEIRIEAKNRCGFCLGEQKYVMAWLEIEHLIPLSKGGTSDQENLWLACPYCNRFKRSQTHALDPITQRKTALFNPRTQIWEKHFQLGTDNATIIGKTICGRATVNALNLNYKLALTTRLSWVSVGWYPPKD
jgi:HNH endonuclease